MEFCSVTPAGRGWRAEGSLVRALKSGPVVATYSVRLDSRWRTKEVKVWQASAGSEKSIGLFVSRGAWWKGEEELQALRGCDDVDLEASPVTNTFPIRRSRMKVGEKVTVTVAWVRFPSLEVVPFTQSYERVGETEYVYRSSTGFSAKLEVDRFGLVRRYGKYWKAL